MSVHPWQMSILLTAALLVGLGEVLLYWMSLLQERWVNAAIDATCVLANAFTACRVVSFLKK
jgi:hypothetical protein